MVEQAGTEKARLIGGRYAVREEIGRGGMGVVWEAWDQVIGRDVAIKELHLPDGLSAEDRRVYEERVLREARTAGRLNDPAVVTVYDVLAEDGGTFIIMELVRAVTLSDLVEKQGALPWEQVAEIARQVLSALEAAHTAGIVHRDVKPSNIMVSDGRVKLADFGIAQAFDDPRITTTGAVLGSPSFMAPERIQGADAVPASDMWSLGATLFFAVEGSLPFERKSTAATLHAVLNEPPRMSKSHGVVGAVILGLLITDPEARFGCAQVRTLLESAPSPATGLIQPVADRTKVSPAPEVKPASRIPWVISAVTSGVVLLAAGVLIGRYAFGGSSPSGMRPPLTFGAGGDIAQLEVGGGECGLGALESGARVPAAKSVGCDEPHDFEIYTTGSAFDSGADVAYPGEEALTRFGEGFCAAYFASNEIVTPGKDEALRFLALVPTEEHWNLHQRTSANSNADDDSGSQSVYCALHSADGGKLSTPSTAN